MSRFEPFCAALCLAGCAMSAAPQPGADLPPDLLRAVLEDARRRSPEAEPRLTQVRAVTWRNGALGCPLPGRAYTDALVPGWQMSVSTAHGVLDYHASRRGAWVMCPASRTEPGLADDRPT